MIEKITQKIVFKIIKERFINEVPFLKLLGIKVSKFDYPEVEMVLDWNNELVGNIVQESLHGGVTATILDSVGGLVAVGNFISRGKNLSISIPFHTQEA